MKTGFEGKNIPAEWKGLKTFWYMHICAQISKRKRKEKRNSKCTRVIRTETATGYAIRYSTHCMSHVKCEGSLKQVYIFDRHLLPACCRGEWMIRLVMPKCPVRNPSNYGLRPAWVRIWRVRSVPKKITCKNKRCYASVTGVVCGKKSASSHKESNLWLSDVLVGCNWNGFKGSG